MKKAVTIFAILLGISLFAPQQAAHAQTQSPQATKVQVTTVHDALKLTFQVKPNTKYSLKDLNNQQLASGKAKENCDAEKASRYIDKISFKNNIPPAHK